VAKEAKTTGPQPPDLAEPVAEHKSPTVPKRYVAYLFDDVHIKSEDLARARDAAIRHFATLRPTDRAALFTTSGLITVDFTDDHSALTSALLKLKPNPISRRGSSFEQAKQEIEDAIFSQELLHDLPLDLHTQYFKSSDDAAKLTILAHLDASHLHFKKADGRNNDELTVVSVLFNGNGNFLQGNQKVVTLHLMDETLQTKLGQGITMKTNFDVKPGSYLVRVVVRDSEGQLSAQNGSVEIP
jgi:hypothetical protein